MDNPTRGLSPKVALWGGLLFGCEAAAFFGSPLLLGSLLGALGGGLGALLSQKGGDLLGAKLSFWKLPIAFLGTGGLFGFLGGGFAFLGHRPFSPSFFQEAQAGALFGLFGAALCHRDHRPLLGAVAGGIVGGLLGLLLGMVLLGDWLSASLFGSLFGSLGGAGGALFEPPPKASPIARGALVGALLCSFPALFSTLALSQAGLLSTAWPAALEPLLAASVIGMGTGAFGGWVERSTQE